MVLAYTPVNTKIPHHKKILNKVNCLLDSLHPRLKEAKPIISGSYAINLLFKPKAPYKDIDFYFESEEDFIIAADCFFDLHADKVTANKNCVIYDLKGFQYQLITRDFKSPQELIKDHDFYNSAIAIQNENIFLLKNLSNLYNEDLLEFQNMQFYNYPSAEKQVLAFNTFFNRVLKYIDRYDFDLSEKAYIDLQKASIWLDEKLKELDGFELNLKTNLYYNLTYSKTDSKALTFSKLCFNFKNFLMQYQENQVLADEDNLF